MTWKPEKKVRALRTWSKMVVVKWGSVFPFFLRWRYSSSRWNFVGGIQTTFKDPDLKRILKLDFWSFDSSLDCVTVLQSFHFYFNFHILLQIMTFFSGFFWGLLNHQVASDAMCVMPPHLVEEVPVATCHFGGSESLTLRPSRRGEDMED